MLAAAEEEIMSCDWMLLYIVPAAMFFFGAAAMPRDRGGRVLVLFVIIFGAWIVLPVWWRGGFGCAGWKP